MSLPPYATIVQDLPSTVPFVGPEAQERKRGRLFRARIGANESVFGPSPRALEAMRREAADAWKYCDPENHDLKHALAAKHGVQPENIVVGEGIDGLFGYIVRLFVEPGVTVATSLGAYPTFNFHVAGYGGRLVTTPYVNDREDPDSLLALANKEKARPAVPRQPGQSDGLLVGRRDRPGADRAASGEHAALPRRGLLRVRAGRHHAADRRRQPAGHPLPHLLQGIRHGRRAHRLRDRRSGRDQELRQDPQPFRRQPHRPGGRARRAGGPGAPRVGAGSGGRGRATASPPSAAPTASRRCPPPPTS